MECCARQDSVIIAVLGSTGTGKSKLGIELAQEFDGEIISADSIQVYKGLDVCSAKVTAEEQAVAKHHLLSVADCAENFDVVKFRDMALPIISDILERGKVPIIVGGTNYYIESLIWHTLMPKPGEEAVKPSSASVACPTPACDTEPAVPGDDRNQPVAGAIGDTGDVTSASPSSDAACAKLASKSTSASLYERLQQVDPEMAARLHPNNTRKIQRSLNVYDQHGVAHSELLKQQHQQSNASCPQGAGVRFPKTCAFWIRCDIDVLDNRLSRRVDGMVAAGMLRELEEFHATFGQQCLGEDSRPCFEHGLFQSIGYKELYPYLSRPESTEPAESESLLKQCLQSLVRGTSRYARKQNAWVRNRFLKAGQLIPLYSVDSSKPENWSTDVLQPATAIVKACMAGDASPVAPLPLRSASKETWKTFECTACSRVLLGDHEWQVHLSSRMHRRRRKRFERFEQQDETTRTADGDKSESD